MAGAHAHLYRKNRWKVKSEEFRKRNPLCVRCLEKGIVTASEVADHVIPHKGDEEAFWAGSLSALCKPCHDLKSAVEDGSSRGPVQTHPEWLPKPACDVVLVCGPAGAGKTTWAKAQAKHNDVVIDLDECFFQVCGVHGHQADKEHLPAAIRVRNRLIANLASKHSGTAYVIVGAPTQRERDWWARKLGARVELINPGLAQIKVQAPSRVDIAIQWFGESKGKWHESAKPEPKVRMLKCRTGTLNTLRR